MLIDVGLQYGNRKQCNTTSHCVIWFLNCAQLCKFHNFVLFNSIPNWVCRNLHSIGMTEHYKDIYWTNSSIWIINIIEIWIYCFMQTAACLLLLLLLLNLIDVRWLRNAIHLFVVYSTMSAVYVSIDLEEHIALACAEFPGVPFGMPKSTESNSWVTKEAQMLYSTPHWK